MQDTKAFVTTFAKLGASSNTMNYVIRGIERFTCALFREKRLSSVDKIRRKNILRKFSRVQKSQASLCSHHVKTAF